MGCSPPSTVRIGIVGVGKLGTYHLKNLLTLQKEDDRLCLQGFYDTNEDHARTIEEHFGVRRYDSWEQLFDEVDAIVIASPTTTHAFYAREALKRGLHTFVEKPLCTDLEEARELVRLARNAGVVTQVGYVERFNPAYRTGRLFLKKQRALFVQAERWAPYTVRGADVPVVLDLMTHDLDLLLATIPHSLVEVAAQGVQVLGEGIDLVYATLHFEHGVMAWLSASRIAPVRRRYFQVYTPEGLIHMNLLTARTRLLRLTSLDPGTLPTDEHLTILQVREEKTLMRRSPQQAITLYQYTFYPARGNALYEEMKAFVEAIQTGKESPVPFWHSLRVLEIAMQILYVVEINAMKQGVLQGVHTGKHP